MGKNKNRSGIDLYISVDPGTSREGMINLLLSDRSAAESKLIE